MNEAIILRDNTCKDCPNRHVGCHNVETCSKWAEHEAKKKDIYDERWRQSMLISIEQKHIYKAYRRISHGQRPDNRSRV